MIYLENFNLLSDDQEWSFFCYRSKGFYDSFYPYQLFPQKQLRDIAFSDIPKKVFVCLRHEGI